MVLLADVLGYFNDVDDDMVLRLCEQAIAVAARVQGRLSKNVAASKISLANGYRSRARRANAADDLDRSMANLHSALPLYNEAALIYRAIHIVEYADATLHEAHKIEELLQLTESLKQKIKIEKEIENGSSS